MDFEALEQNLADVIQEIQIKLGYAETPVGLYYPLESLNRLLQTNLNTEQMQRVLVDFSGQAAERYGKISCTHEGDRFCLTVPAEGVAYVRSRFGENPFLREFIRQTERHDCKIQEICQVFARFSDRVVCREISGGEFDYLIYFEDGIPDDYRYCIKFEGRHVIYHRFTSGDYAAMQVYKSPEEA